jgi:hypothetical protein
MHDINMTMTAICRVLLARLDTFAEDIGPRRKLQAELERLKKAKVQLERNELLWEGLEHQAMSECDMKMRPLCCGVIPPPNRCDKYARARTFAYGCRVE